MNSKPLIMIVDDDPNIAQLINLYLVKEGFDRATKAAWYSCCPARCGR